MYYSDTGRRRSVDRLAVELFAEKRAHLLGVARHNSRREADAEDALQEAFAAFIATYDPSRGSPPLAWLTLTLKRACWRMRERCGDREVCFEPSALAEIVAEESLDPAPRVLEREEARRRLGRLKVDERTAIVLHAAGFDYGEIGARCGWTHTKVNRCLYEGRRALRNSREA
jgi:RNA polymerase sigma factor (sigma-70 family)